MMGWMAPLRHLSANCCLIESAANGSHPWARLLRSDLTWRSMFFRCTGVDAEGATVLRKQLRRAQVLAFFSRLPPCLVGLEACATAHYWGRDLARRSACPAGWSHCARYLRQGRT